MKKKSHRDVEKTYPVTQFITKLRRLARALEQHKPFTLQVSGERIAIPKRAIVNIEHERSKTGEEVEFQMKWKK